MSDRLGGKVALVTGSSHGIGTAIALRFARDGARVAVHGRDGAAVSDVAARIGQTRGEAIGVTGDVTRFDDLEAMRARIEQELGPVDVLVANAGGNPVRPGPVDQVSEDGWRATIDANLTATFLTVKCFLPGMKERGSGSIITMSSAAARRPTEASPVPYAAAKAGIEVLTRSLALQAGPSGVRVNCVAPETILTERNQQQIPAAVQEQLIGMHPVRRLGTPEDVAAAVCYMASDDAAWVSGIVLDVAGGSVLA
jgi:3-oxoacyl-[acyl-carrier protein] reductase